ncbi:MAG: hypothetical protein ABSB50_20580 [Terracidiphilus sp.]|jgi:transposase-like protein
MTSQTKHYIELSDILSVRCDCKECGASLSLPLASNLADALFKCPKCGKSWVRFQGGTYELTIATFMKSLEDLKGLLPNAGFNLHFEIAADLVSGGRD